MSSMKPWNFLKVPNTSWSVIFTQKHRIGYHEKTLGQLFCDDEAEVLISMLREECDAAGVKRFMNCESGEINYSPAPDDELPDNALPAKLQKKKESHKFHVSTSRGEFNSNSRSEEH